MKRIGGKIERNRELEESLRMWETNDGNLKMKYSVNGSYMLPKYSVIKIIKKYNDHLYGLMFENYSLFS